MMRLCEVCETRPGDRWTTCTKETGGSFSLWTCPIDALWLAAPLGVDLVT